MNLASGAVLFESPGVYLMAVVIGQSLAIGAGASPISTHSEHPTATHRARNPLSPLSVDGATGQVGCSLGYRLHEHTGRPIVVTTTGAGGSSLAQISRGGATGAYEQAILDVRAAAHATRNQSARLEVAHLHLVHGETDMVEGTEAEAYRRGMRRLLDDYRADVAASTGQGANPEMLACQVNSWPGFNLDEPTIGLAQLAEHGTNDAIHLVGPRYQVPLKEDGIHPTAVGYYRLGEYHARVAAARMAGQPWEPLRPVTATLDGATIRLQFLVPVPPLRLDTTLVAAQEAHGFSVVDGAGGGLEIASVVLGGDGTSVHLRLADAAHGDDLRVRYGFRSQYGNLCDSESAVSAHDGVRLANWCVHFEQRVG